MPTDPEAEAALDIKEIGLVPMSCFNIYSMTDMFNLDLGIVQVHVTSKR